MERRPAPWPSLAPRSSRPTCRILVSLERAFDGVHGVFSVQNHHISGYEGEVRQGKQVAEVAKRVGVSQLVYYGVLGSCRRSARGTPVQQGC
jgi:NmrA-like family